ncbi:uncharacterized protein LOC128233477 [Mya arenaria]|uniref:uncharacterized protein LOC128233477 n=1 Tax=Mya arenaria TaxID=6604 RepID=UPI0022E5E4F0|nr:uncharacterized protein LOC128233477 [Mya arenaria]
MTALFSLALLLVVSGCSTTSSVSPSPAAGGVKSLDPPALEAFLVPFREVILQKVAVEWNHTITDSARLTVALNTCSDQLKTAVNSCKSCAENTCRTPTEHQAIQQSATFKDYLNLAVQLVNPVNYLKGPLNEVGDKFGDLVDLLGTGSSSFIDSMVGLGNSAGEAFTSAFHGIEGAYNSVKDTLSSVVGTGIGGITDIGNTVGDGFSSAGNAIKDVGNTILHGIGSIFGRKRATVNPELLRCMQPCSVCQPLLLPTHDETVSSVCGAEVIKFNQTVRTNVRLIKSIFAAVSDKQHPVIADIKYDPSSAHGLTFTRIYVTANIGGQYFRYQSSVAYDMVNVGSTAAKVAVEFWQLWERALSGSA